MLAEDRRLAEADGRTRHWKRWGPYLAERAWGTVREDYSTNGDVWEYFPHDDARSRTYRWTEDGILGICDNHQYLCFALAFWNGKDPILKERLFGLTGKEGNHGEDVKELYYYIDATPTNSYLKGLYKYPQNEYPYADLVDENKRRGRLDPEYEIEDTGVFNEDRYFDIFAEYAKVDVDDVLIRVTVVNRGPDTASLTVLPTLWFRNTWSWGGDLEVPGCPKITKASPTVLCAEHTKLGKFLLTLEGTPKILFTDNETNTKRLFGAPSERGFYKDGFHDYVIRGSKAGVCSDRGTKACGVYGLELEAGETKVLHLRFAREGSADVPAESWDGIFEERIRECSEFYAGHAKDLNPEAANVQKQAFAGMFWSKQYYHFVVDTWLKGDLNMPEPPPQRRRGRDSKWSHLFNEDVISMPDKWEYPWYAAWDLAFHCVAIAPVDPEFSKAQLALFVREWYMHPNGQLPAYEWAFGDVNPPVHAWAAWRTFKIEMRRKGTGDREFLQSVFQKLLMNFTWWVNRKDSEGANIFEGGFLGLDNIGIFNRDDIPHGWTLEQSDGSSWMAMFCLNMLKIALHLAEKDRAYEDIASKFFEHFLYISHAIHAHGGTGLWDEQDGFYYDRLRLSDDNSMLVRIRSLVGLVPLFATDTIEQEVIDRHPGFKRRMQWFIDHRPDLTGGIASIVEGGVESRRLLSVVNRERLERILQRLFDEDEFLSQHGIRSLSRYYKDHPYRLGLDGKTFQISYEPADSQSGLYGGNSNWRGPIWFPMNFLIIEALQRLHRYYGDDLKVEFPARSGNRITLQEAARELSRRLSSLFLRDAEGARPACGGDKRYEDDPNYRDYLLFHEFFDGDTGKGLGASHQTGWTGLVAKLLEQSGTAS